MTLATRTKQVLIAIGLLTMAELVACVMLQRSGRAFMPIAQLHRFAPPSGQELELYGFDEIDPLLGWGMSTGHLQSVGFEVKNNMPVLRSGPKGCEATLRLLITGGSTSDVALHRENWPADLVPLLEEQGICAEIYVGAVGGYASGQELLKTLRDGRGISPDLHISYSGANETSHPYFVTTHEQDLYERMMRTETSFLLPNLVFVLRSKLWSRRQATLHVHPAKEPDWAANMEAMNAIATAKGYAFIGVLQPVLGTGKVVQPKEEAGWISLVDSYRQYYPKAVASIAGRPYLVNMTAIFDHVKAPVYVDDCHLRPEMQHIVAEQMLALILAHRNADRKVP